MTARERRTIKQRIDRILPDGSRFCKRSGATTMAEHRARIALLNRLLEADQLDVIHALSNDEISWSELRQAERKKRLHSDALAADIALSRRLWDDGEIVGALSATLARMGKTESSRTRYEVAFAQLKKHAVDFLPGRAIVKDLKAVPWSDAFATMAELSPASRNRVRSAISAFLTVFLGDKFHPFRRDVMKAMGGMEDENVQPKEITLDEFWTNLAATDPAVQPTILTLAGSGIRIGEYLQCDEFSARRLPSIWLPAGKTGAAEAQIAEHLVPFARQAIPCRLAPAPKVWRGVQFDARYKRIWKAMAAASATTGTPWSPHYLRHLYAQIGTAELPEGLVQQGLRHKTASMTRRYANRRTTKAVAEAVGAALIQPKAKKPKAASGTKGVRGKVRGAVQRKAI